MIVEAECIVATETVETCDAYLCFYDGSTWPAKFRTMKLDCKKSLTMCYIDLSGIDTDKLAGIFWKIRDVLYGESPLQELLKDG